MSVPDIDRVDHSVTAPIPAYYINLDRAVVRRAHMEAEAARVGVSMARLSAVDGATLSQAEVDALRGPGGTHHLAPPEMACNLSHFAAWKRVAEGDTPFGAVFEDDVLMSDDLGVYLNDWSWIPEGADIVKLETFGQRTLVAPPFLRLSTGRTLGRLKMSHLGAAAYILSRDFARRLVALDRKWGALPDQVLFNPEHFFVRGGKIWQMTPAACIQQIIHETRFLPDGAADSVLMQYRQKERRRGLAKLGRELVRPFIRIPKNIYVAGSVMRGGRWGIIPFSKAA